MTALVDKGNFRPKYMESVTKRKSEVRKGLILDVWPGYELLLSDFVPRIEIELGKFCIS
jgi:hypothetical protein